jgi:hypothetical protein
MPGSGNSRMNVEAVALVFMNSQLGWERQTRNRSVCSDMGGTGVPDESGAFFPVLLPSQHS